MSCIYCKNHQDYAKFDVYPDTVTPDFLLIEQALNKRITNYIGIFDLSNETGTVVECPTCYSKWRVICKMHILQTDPMPKYYTIKIKVIISHS